MKDFDKYMNEHQTEWRLKNVDINEQVFRMAFNVREYFLQNYGSSVYGRNCVIEESGNYPATLKKTASVAIQAHIT